MLIWGLKRAAFIYFYAAFIFNKKTHTQKRKTKTNTRFLSSGLNNHFCKLLYNYYCKKNPSILNYKKINGFIFLPYIKPKCMVDYTWRQQTFSCISKRICHPLILFWHFLCWYWYVLIIHLITPNLTDICLAFVLTTPIFYWRSLFVSFK